MEAIDEIQLPPVMQDENLEQLPATPDNPELNSTNNLPTISTDDLPITPLRNKRWLNSVALTPESQKTKISLNLTPVSKSPSKSATKLQDSDKSPYVENSSSYNELNLNLPNTDNLLDINVPKTTLLGKEQAKKRLHAFSLSKQSSLNVSPFSKKKSLKQPRFLLQQSEDKYNENGEKTEEKFVLVKKPARKSANPNEKAKAVIEEIEEIKKIESAYLEALEQGLLDQRNRRSRSKSRSRERSKRHSSRKEHRRSRSVETKSRKSWDKPRYPHNWTEVNNKGYDFETLVNMKPKEYKNKDNEPTDYRKLLLFQTPSLPLHRLTVKSASGKEKIVPPEYVRFTNKSPRISYSVKEKMPNDFYSRKCVLQYVPKFFRETMKKITNNSALAIDLGSPTKSTNRKWFPKTVLSKVEDNTECKILESSLGLSFLQTYSDEDEQEKEINEDEETDVTDRKSQDDMNHSEKIIEVLEEREETPELKLEVIEISGSSDKLEANVEIIDSEEEIEEKVEKHEKVKKRKKKEKKKEKSKPKKEKFKKKKKQKKTKPSKEDKHEKTKKRKNSTGDDDKKKQPDKHKEYDNKKSDESRKNKRNRSKSNDTKDKGGTSSKNEKSDQVTKSKKRTNSGDTDKSVKEDHVKNDSNLSKCDNSVKRESRKNKTDQSKEKRDSSPKKNLERNKIEGKHKSRSKSRETKSKKSEKVTKSKSPNNEQELRKVKCVAEKEFGTPDTEEYYSNWESDVELTTNSGKRSAKSHNESTSINQSWQSDEDLLEISDITISDIPLVKSPFKDETSPPVISQQQNKDKSGEQSKRAYKRDKSIEKRRSSLRDRSSSPLRATRSRHLDNFPLELSPIQNEFSSIQNEFSPKQFSPMQLSPAPNDFSPFRNRIEERRRSRRSMERSPPEEFLEMPLNIRNTRNSYSRKQWEEERFDDGKYNRSPDHVEFNDNKMYALYADNQWERDDYLTIKTEEIRLEEERRTLIEERRKLEIERRKFEELERQRYYNRMTEFDEKRCGFEERRQEEFKISDDEEKRYRPHRDYRETREHPQYPKENDIPLSRRSSEDQRDYRETREHIQYSKENDIPLSRRSSEDQRSRRRYTPERSPNLQRERMRDSFNWEDTVENKRTEKYSDKSVEQEANKRRRKSRWQNIDDLEPLHHEPYTKTEQEASHSKNDLVSSNKAEHKSYGKEKKIVRRNRWESSEDEIVVRDDKKSGEKIQSRQEHKKVKDNKYKEKRDKECLLVNKEKHKRTYKREEEGRVKSLTDNLNIPPRKPISRTTAQKPEVLENEYEKFMQALGSEISTAEEISEKDFQQQKRKSKPGDKRIKKRKSYSRSVSISSDEEFEKSSKREIRKRKTKKRVSSSSSSSTSSSSSGSDSSTDSSSITSSSEFSSDEEKRRRFKKQKMEAVKVKIEDTSYKKQEKMEELKVISPQSNMSNFDVITASRMKEKEIKELVKNEDPKDLTNSKTRLVAPNKIPTVGANLNIINLTIPDFARVEIPLSNPEVLKPPVLKSSEVPLPVPSPNVSLIATTNDVVLQKLDPIVTKIEPITLALPKNEFIADTNPIAPILSEIIPVRPVIPTLAASTSTFECEFSDLNTSVDVHDVKEEPTTPEENKFAGNSFLTDLTISPSKRNNLIPIKFLTAELRKQASDSPHLKPLGSLDTKDNLIPSIYTIDVKTNTILDKNDAVEALPLTNRKRHFAMSSINLPAKRPLLDGSEKDENSTDFTDKFVRKDDSMEEVSTTDVQFIETIEFRGRTSYQRSSKSREKSFEREGTSRDYSKDRRRHRSISPRRKRDLSPRSSIRDSRSPHRYDSSKRWSKDVSPRRREREISPRSQRMSSPGRWDRNGSPRRGSRDRATRRGRDDSHRRNSITPPRQKDSRRDYRSISPGTKKHVSPRYHSPSPKRHSMSREFSPRRHRSKDRSPSKDRKLESIQETLQRIAGVDKYSNRMKRSPISSPLHGFKRSVADSTISDDQLLQHNSEEYVGSPAFNTEYFKNTVTNTASPKRMSLDERISQALGLGLADQQPKPISTTYSQNYECDPQYFDQFGQYYEQYGEQSQKSEYGQSAQSYRQSRQRGNSNLKVVQVGNVLQVVPTEDVPPPPKQVPPPPKQVPPPPKQILPPPKQVLPPPKQVLPPPKQVLPPPKQVPPAPKQVPPASKQPPVQQNKVTNSTQKIVQVGNMLQIVPTTTLPEVPVKAPTPPLPPPLPPPVPSTPPPSTSLIKDPLNAEALIKQKVERRAEKDKRRQEREKKRKEKEKKRKEREKRKQLKVKMQTEAMIKQALIQDTEEVAVGNEENLNLENTIECQPPVQWPPVPQIVCNNSYKPAGKGILSQGSRRILNEEGESKRKTVKFSDGVMPGEGTSPSGGEELSSPPPAPKKLPKEKRFIKTKVPKKVEVPKKKKVKVKVIRQQQTQGTEDDDEDEDDNLPPPPPPPGSPPPHLFPARVKQPVINNIHPTVVVSIANPPLQPTNTSVPPPPVYRQTPPPVIMSHHGHHHGPPHLPPYGPPPHGHHHHPPPCPPPCPPPHHHHHPPTVIVPPVVTVLPRLLRPFRPHHVHVHHHGGHHSPHHGHHHH